MTWLQCDLPCVPDAAKDVLLLGNWPFKNFWLLELFDTMTFSVGCPLDFWKQDTLKKPGEAEKKG